MRSEFLSIRSFVSVSTLQELWQWTSFGSSFEAEGVRWHEENHYKEESPRNRLCTNEIMKEILSVKDSDGMCPMQRRNDRGNERRNPCTTALSILAVTSQH